MGANIYPEDVEAGLLSEHELASHLGYFCMELEEIGDTGEVRPCIHVEVLTGDLSDELTSRLQQAICTKLAELSADFRQAMREDQSTSQLKVQLHAPGQGPFAEINRRIKRKYVVGKK
jgi:phenylacetate-CoA ligase